MLNPRQLNSLPSGWHLDDRGLYLKVEGSADPRSRRWVLRTTFGGRRKEYALGTLAKGLSLAAAREKAETYRQLLAAGVDPADHFARAQLLEQQRRTTFGEVAESYIEVVKLEFKNAKHINQWRTTLLGGGKGPDYCARIRDIPIGKLTQEDVEAVLAPIWHEVPETAYRLRQRIARVWTFAKARRMVEGDNPAEWANLLKESLRKPPSVKKSRRDKDKMVARGHQPAIPYADLPAFYRKLEEIPGLSSLVLRFLILTGCRSGEVRGVEWQELEIDGEVPLWTIPENRMKAGKEHIVPLSKQAVCLLKASPTFDNRAERRLVFTKTGRALSDSAMSQLLKVKLDVEWTAHGMRSSLRDWIGEETEYPRELAEHVLAHNVGSAVERAYARLKQAKKREPLMQRWADYVCSASQHGAGNG